MITFIILIIILIFLIILIILLYKPFKKGFTQNTFKKGFVQKNNYANKLFLNEGKKGFTQKNILGTDLIPCCDGGDGGKITGFNRDGMCSSNATDTGTHIICAIVDDNFLEFTKTKGNDLITPSGTFPGLVAGDKWCLCILRWIEAHKAGKAPKIIPESTNELALKYVSKEILMNYITF
jgi:uncharacterized protein (DUF2237 family)